MINNDGGDMTTWKDKSDKLQQEMHNRVKDCLKFCIPTDIVIKSMAGQIMTIGLGYIIGLGKIDDVPVILKEKGLYYFSVTTYH